MTPRDPDLCPDLERAHPADDIPGGPYREDGVNWLVRFGDGVWYPVTVRAWRADRLGREVIDVEFFAGLTDWGASYLADRRRMWDGRGPKGARRLGRAPGPGAPEPD